MTGFDHEPTPEERRASLSYMLGFTDGMMWCLAHPGELERLLFEVIAAPAGGVRPLHQSISFEASQLYDAAGADPDAWAGDENTEAILDLKPDPDWRPPS